MAGKPKIEGGSGTGWGGKRPGAGRKPEPPPVVSVPQTADALEFLLSVMNHPDAPLQQRVRAAVAAVQYQRTKRGDGGKKDEAADKAKAAASGRFGPSAPPLKLVD